MDFEGSTSTVLKVLMVNLIEESKRCKIYPSLAIRRSFQHTPCQVEKQGQGDDRPALKECFPSLLDWFTKDLFIHSSYPTSSEIESQARDTRLG